MTKARDVSDLAKDGDLPADVGAGAVPVSAPVLARDFATKMAKEQLDSSAIDMPSHVPSECELIAAVLWAGTFSVGRITVDTVSDLLDNVAAFHLPAHRAIWDACVALNKAGKPPTSVSVHTEMVQRKSERNSGGLAYLEVLVRDAKPTSEVTARSYAQTVRDTWVRRLLIEGARRIEASARDKAMTAEDAASAAVAGASAIAGVSVGANRAFVRLSQAIVIMSKDMDVAKRPSLMTGFRDIDEKTGGLTLQETSILAARTSVGKTAVACQWAENIARESNNTRAVFYVSLEMRAALFAGRLTANRAGVEAKKLRRGTLTPDEKFYIRKAAFDMGKLHLYFVDNLVQTLESIHSAAKSLRKKLAAEGVELALIVIDHMGLVKPSAASVRKDRKDQVGETSRGLRYLATEHNCHVLGLAQINRDAAKRTGADAIPKIHEIKDCGDIEQDADNVFILHRDRSKAGVFTRGTGADFIIAKARNDETAHIKLSLEEDFVRFGDSNERP